MYLIPLKHGLKGGQRHLSAESALYCRTVIEGLFNIIPISFRKFSINPHLPIEWNYMRLKRIKAFDQLFDVEVVLQGRQEFLIVKAEDGKIIKKTKMQGNAFEIVL